MGVAVHSDMQKFLQSLQQKIAAEEAAAAAAAAVAHRAADDEVSDSSDDSLQPWSPPQIMERSVEYTNGDTYKGAMLGDQRHGRGTHTTSIGDVYEGGWSYDLRQGHGKFKTRDGVTYEGDWENDKTHGDGKCTYADGSTYEGEWQSDKRHGWGVFKTADGQHYEGEWKDDKMHGDGRWVFADGLSYFEGKHEAGKRKHGQQVMFDLSTKKQIQSYTGSFKNHLRHGEGVGVEEGLWVYRGTWSRDMRHGHGSCTYADGTVYEGAWKSDKRHGTGKLKLTGGYWYEGDWSNDKQHETGKARYANGDRYIGHWQNGKRHGQGKWTSAPITVPAAAAAATGSSTSGSSKEHREQYIGSWVDDCRDGQGVMVYADGGRYQGSWKAGQRHGEGLMAFPDGILFRGQWEDDEWVQSSADPSLTRVRGPGLARAVAGQPATFVIKARDENNQPRLSGGDSFQVMLVPRPILKTAASSPVAAAAATPVEGMSLDLPADGQQQQQQQYSPGTLDGGMSQEYSSSGIQQQLGRSKLISHPLLLPYSSSNFTSSSRQNSVISLQHSQVDVKSQTSLDHISLHTDEDTHVSLHAYDDYDVSLHTESATVEAVAVGEVQDLGDGTYSCSYTHTVAGLFELHITNVDGDAVADSPYPIKILPGPPSARHSTVAGSGRRTATAGAMAEFVVHVKDAEGNGYELMEASAEGLLQLQANLLGSNTLPVASISVKSAPGGCYSCSYTAPYVAGLYVLEVTAGGKHLRGSPFSVKVTEPERIAVDEATSAAAVSTSANNTHNTMKSVASVPDRVKWWGEVAREAYAAVDGCLDGFEVSLGLADQAGDQTGLAGPEAELVKANPDLPVVERLEDLWLLSKLQQEKKLQQQKQKQQQQRRREPNQMRQTANLQAQQSLTT